MNQDTQLELEILEFAEGRDGQEGWERPPGLWAGSDADIRWERVARGMKAAKTITGMLEHFSFGSTIDYMQEFNEEQLHIGHLTDSGRKRLAELRRG